MKRRLKKIVQLLAAIYFIFLLPEAFAVKEIDRSTATKKALKTATDPADVVEAVLNGLKITMNKQTGSITGLEYPGVGKILEASPERSGLIDLAYPMPEFEALKLASRFSKDAKIERTSDAVIISWDNVGASRTYFKPSGNVSVKVWLTAMPDRRSVSLKCQVVNKADRPVGQVLFPDLHGLLPLAGKEGTYLRTAGFVRKPFLDVGRTMYPEFYAPERETDTQDTYQFTGGAGVGDGNSMIGRWLDYGGLNGGISLFPKVWKDAPATKVRIFRLEKDPNVRLMHEHDERIKPGQTWESPEYVLTPHQSGWAKGIETYRDFVSSNVKRMFPVPEHVRKGLGFRTIYMSRWYPADGENDRTFTFADLPKVAKECKENGIDQMVVWHWFRHFILPIQDPYSNLGTPEELSEAIKECNKLGVDVSLAVSITSASEPTASRYGLKVGKGGWTYHPEMIPRFNPSYTAGRATVHANTNDPRWKKDALSSVKKVYDNYSHSITWDEARPGIEPVVRQFLPWVKKSDPRATFSGEITKEGLELSADYLDFTWNWHPGSYHFNLLKPYRDFRGFNTSFPAPRLNYNINRNAQDIKYAFMDNSYVNIMPSKPDYTNGTAMISDYPELGRVLKQCAGLRNQFLKYFTDGTLIGECLLNKESPNAHVSAYVLPDRVLFMVMNTENESRKVDFKVDLEPWLKAAQGKYEVKSYDQYGKSTGAKKLNSPGWEAKTKKLDKMGLAVYEFIAK